MEIDCGICSLRPWRHGDEASRCMSARFRHPYTADDLLRLQATIYAPNAASARVAEKCGYLKEAVLRKAIAKDGEIYDAMIYAKVR